METLLTRKFKLHWETSSANEQDRLHRFYQDYIAKANEMIQYVFSLKPQYDQQSSTAFMELFKKADKKAYNDLYTYSLDLKTYSSTTQSGLRLKQRTMRMLCNDIYYPIRNHLIRLHNLERILSYKKGSTKRYYEIADMLVSKNEFRKLV